MRIDELKHSMRNQYRSSRFDPGGTSWCNEWFDCCFVNHLVSLVGSPKLYQTLEFFEAGEQVGAEKCKHFSA